MSSTRRVVTIVAVIGLVGLAAAIVLPGLFMSTCVLAGTLIDTPTGPRVVESLRVGDAVTGGTVAAIHAGWATEYVEILAADGRVLRATSEHPLAAGSGWRSAGSLQEGDLVGATTIARVVRRRALARVFDLEVEPTATFVADGFLVHNKSSPERNATTGLKTIATAEQDFRSNDREGNQECEFWVADVRGLWAILRDGKRLDLIEHSVAFADAAARPGAAGFVYDEPAGYSPGPKFGYWYRALPYYEDASGRKTPYDTGGGRNRERFGFIAYPDKESRGKAMFMINEETTIWRKDWMSAPIDTYPRDPAAAGWRKVDY